MKEMVVFRIAFLPNIQSKLLGFFLTCSPFPHFPSVFYKEGDNEEQIKTIWTTQNYWIIEKCNF